MVPRSLTCLLEKTCFTRSSVYECVCSFVEQETLYCPWSLENPISSLHCIIPSSLFWSAFSCFMRHIIINGGLWIFNSLVTLFCSFSLLQLFASNHQLIMSIVEDTNVILMASTLNQAYLVHTLIGIYFSFLDRLDLLILMRSFLLCLFDCI